MSWSYMVHECELKQADYGFRKLPPNASIFSKIFRVVRKFTTLDPESEHAKKFFRNRTALAEEQRRHLREAPFFIIHPFSKVNIIRKQLFVMIWFLLLVWNPVTASFVALVDFDEKIFVEKVSPFVYVGFAYIVHPLQILLIISFFFTGYVHNSIIVIKFKKIAGRYLITYFPFDLASALVANPDVNINFSLVVSTILYMLIYARIGTTLSYIRQLLLHVKVRSEYAWCIILLLITFFMLHCFSCLFYMFQTLIHSESNWPEKAWPTKTGVDPDNHPTVFKAYAAIFLLVTCHFFGAGHTSIHIKLANEELMMVITMIVGRVWTLCLIAYLLRVFSIVTISEDKYEEYLVELKEYMRQKNLPKELSERLIEYYRYKYHLHYFNETAIFTTLSAYIRQELMLWSARKLISKVELFRSFPRSVVSAIIGSCKSNIYLNGDIVAKAGDPVNYIYFISSGTLAVLSADGYHELAHLEDGNEIGLISAIDPLYEAYRYNYIAVETSEIYHILKKDFKVYLEDNQDILKFFRKTTMEKIFKFKRTEEKLRGHGTDLLSELSGGKILERPRKRTTFFDN